MALDIGILQLSDVTAFVRPDKLWLCTFDRFDHGAIVKVPGDVPRSFHLLSLPSSSRPIILRAPRATASPPPCSRRPPPILKALRAMLSLFVFFSRSLSLFPAAARRLLRGEVTVLREDPCDTGLRSTQSL